MHIINLIMMYALSLAIYLSGLISLANNVYAQSIYFIFLSFLTILSRVYLFRESAFSFYSLYYLTFLVFIGGSFLVYPFYSNDILCRNVFGYVCLNENVQSESFFFLISAILFIELGYFLKKNNKRDLESEIETIDRAYTRRCYLFCVFLIFTAFPLLYKTTYTSIIDAVNFGYLSAFKNSQSDSYSTPLALLALLFVTVGLGLSYTIKHQYPRFYKAYLLLFIINSFMSIMTGGRAGLVTTLFMILWFKYHNKKGGGQLIKLFFLSVIIVIVLNYIMTLTGRLVGVDMSFSDLVFNLIDSQGVTFFVFSLSTTITDYPVLPYIKTIIPGSAVIYNLIVERIAPHSASFPNYLSWKIDSDLYGKGYGLGWSLFSDFYLFSLGIYPVYLLFCVFWGRLLAILSQNSCYTNGLVVALMPSIYLANRSTISSIVPYFILYTVIFFILKKIRL